MRRQRLDRIEFQQRINQCVLCDALSRWFVMAIRPASGGRRTDMQLFGVCDQHKDEAPLVAAENGFESITVVEYAGLPVLIQRLPYFGVELVG